MPCLHSFLRLEPMSVVGTTRGDAVAEEVHDYLTQLDTLRSAAERQGDFLKAHECVTRMRDANLRYAKLLASQAHKANASAKVEAEEDHRRELLTFRRLWDDKLAQYEEEAAAVVAELRARHTAEFHAQEGALRVQLMNRRPRFSRDVVQLRAQLESFVRQRQYLEAEEAKRALVAAEAEEVAAFDESLAATFERKANVFRTQFTNELKAVEHKIATGRDALLSARASEFDKLEKRHLHAARGLDHATQLHVSKTKQHIQKQVTALVRDPVKTGMELRSLAATARGTPARRARTPPSSRWGASAAQARTPRATTSSTEDSRFGW